MSTSRGFQNRERLNGLAAAATIKVVCLAGLFFYGCASSPHRPKDVDNICDIFRENKKWYNSARSSFKRWGIPIPVMMAIIHQESNFIADARPPRTTCLFVLPGPRPSSAYGYAQASDQTWEAYRKSTGNSGADRDDFGDAIDFVGWYCNTSYRKNGISKKDAYNLYLAYHEGHGGYSRKTYQKKAWLLKLARKVQKRADKYTGQLASCEGEFIKKGCCCLWPF